LALTVGPGGQITVEHVRTGVGYVRQDTVFDLLEEIGKRRTGRAVRLVESLMQRGEPPQKIWFMIAKTLREYALLHSIVMDRPDLGLPLLAILKKVLALHGKTDFRANQDRKAALEEMADALKGWPGPLVQALGLEKSHQGRNLALAIMFSPAELQRLDDRLIELDRAFKSSPPNPALLLQRFLLETLPKKAGDTPRPVGPASRMHARNQTP
jgi:DNA polymerase III delta subunit